MAEVRVQVGPVTATDNDARFDESELGVWVDFSVRTLFDKKPHTYCLGITSPNGFAGMSAAFVQLAAPTLVIAVDWTACRLVLPPAVPATAPPIPDWVFLGAMPELANLDATPDGQTPIYRVSGTYFYGHKDPSLSVYDDVQFALPPYLLDQFSRTYAAALQQLDIIARPQGGTTSASAFREGG